MKKAAAIAAWNGEPNERAGRPLCGPRRAAEAPCKMQDVRDNLSFIHDTLFTVLRDSDLACERLNLIRRYLEWLGHECDRLAAVTHARPDAKCDRCGQPHTGDGGLCKLCDELLGRQYGAGAGSVHTETAGLDPAQVSIVNTLTANEAAACKSDPLQPFRKPNPSETPNSSKYVIHGGEEGKDWMESRKLHVEKVKPDHSGDANKVVDDGLLRAIGNIAKAVGATEYHLNTRGCEPAPVADASKVEPDRRLCCLCKPEDDGLARELFDAFNQAVPVPGRLTWEQSYGSLKDAYRAVAALVRRKVRAARIEELEWVTQKVPTDEVGAPVHMEKVMQPQDVYLERFELWVEQNGLGLCLDQVFMSTDGVPVNPYEDETTKAIYAAFIAGLAISTNYVADTYAAPQSVTFFNGRRVFIRDGCLDVENVDPVPVS